MNDINILESIYDHVWHVGTQICILADLKDCSNSYVKDVRDTVNSMSTFGFADEEQELSRYRDLLFKCLKASASLVNPTAIRTKALRTEFNRNSKELFASFDEKNGISLKLLHLIERELIQKFGTNYVGYDEIMANTVEIDLDMNLLEGDLIKFSDPVPSNSLGVTPSEIVKQIDDRVVGNEQAKRAVAIHLITGKAKGKMDEYYKTPHLLLVGGTGTGKTLIVESLAKELKMPFYTVDCSQITKAGYKGVNLASLLGSIVKDRMMARDARDESYGLDMLELATPGILLLDEFDKMILNERTEYSVQPELLRLLDTGTAQVETGTGRDDTLSVSFRKYSIILAGAFTSVATDKTKKTARIGETAKVYDDSLLTVHDLVKAGLMPELAGRIGTIVSTEPFDDWRPVINLKKGGLRNYYNELFELMGLNRTVTEEDVDAIIAAGKKRGTGLRGLWAAAEAYYRDVLFF